MVFDYFLSHTLTSLKTGGTFYSSYFDNSNRRTFDDYTQLGVGMFNSDLVPLNRPKNQVELNNSQSKFGQQLRLTNVYFD
jgi:hypothetical protein